MEETVFTVCPVCDEEAIMSSRPTNLIRCVLHQQDEVGEQDNFVDNTLPMPAGGAEATGEDCRKFVEALYGRRTIKR
jgi:hypothetical protein